MKIMFTKPKNIETAFQQIRLFCLVVIGFAFVFSGYMAYESHRNIAAAQEKIYILASGKTLEAFASDRKEIFR